MIYKNFVISCLLFTGLWIYMPTDSMGADEMPYARGFHLGFAFGGSELSNDLNNYLGLPEGTLSHFALKLGYDINKYFAIQASLSGDVGTLQTASGVEVGEFSGSLFDVNVKISPLYGRLRPYLVAGIGGYQPEFTAKLRNVQATVTGDTQGTVNIGVGLNINVSRRNSLGIEVVHHRISSEELFGTGFSGDDKLTGDEIFSVTAVAIDYFYTF